MLALGSGLVALATIVGTAITVADHVATNDTQPLSLHVAPLSPDSTLITYVLPFDAPIDTYPAFSEPTCSPARLKWLEAHGKPRPTEYAVEIRNDAKDGGQLSLRNLRARGTSTPVTDPVLLIGCEMGGGGADAVELEVNVDSDRPAVEIDQPDRRSRPFGFNLTPGETGTLLITTTGQHDFAGRLTVEVTVEGRTSAVDLPASPDGGTAFAIAGTGIEADRLATMTENPGEFTCYEGKERYPCDATEVRLLTARAWDRPDLVREIRAENPFRVPGGKTGEVTFSHPTWGDTTLITSHVGATNESWMTAFDSAGQTRWSRHWDWPRIGLNDPATDSTGHLFVTFNPGRYDGVIVLAPSTDGFDDFGTLPKPGEFQGEEFGYDAEASDEDGDGVFEVVQHVNACDPTCAEDTSPDQTYSWTGSDYRAD